MPVLGICNGFQILCESHLLPGALIRNDHRTFICRDQTLKVENASTAWTSDLAVGEEIVIPLKNGEGGFVADADTLDRLEGEGQVVFRYVDVNPNGSLRDIAGITNERGNVVGLMPHPEHAVEDLTVPAPTVSPSSPRPSPPSPRPEQPPLSVTFASGRHADSRPKRHAQRGSTLPPGHSDEGLRAAAAIREDLPTLPILVLSQYVADAYLPALMDSAGTAGIGYLLKDRVGRVADFLASLDQVVDGQTVVDPEVVRQLLARRSDDGPLAALTAREREVLALMAEGRTNGSIAEALFVSDAAVRKHVGSIFAKLDLGDDNDRRVSAVLTYLRG